MSLLAVDVGNSRIKLALFEEGAVTRSWSVATRPESSSGDDAEIARSAFDPLKAVSPAAIGGAAIASVVAGLTPAIEVAVRRLLGVAPLVVDAEMLSRVMRIDVERGHVGVDRLLNALAVAVEWGGPAIVVDVGTAATFDVVSADGAFLGGAIAPGPGAVLDALRRAAPALPAVELRRPPRAIGTDTLTAMQSGLVNGYVGLVSGLLAGLRAELVERAHGARVTVVATGGYAEAPWIRDLPGIDAVDRDLTLRGLRLAHARLTSGAAVSR